MINPNNPDFSNTPVSPKRPKFQYGSLDRSTNPYVTIVTPYYNTGEIFHETALSVQKQSFQQWEWIIINDASDNTYSLSILDEYRNKDPRIRVIDHDRNKGLSAARNTGFYSSKCKYVVQLDSDDLLEPTTTEKWLWFLESYPEYAFCKGFSVGFGAMEYLWNKGFHNGREFLKENLVDPTSIIRKEVHDAVNGYDESIRDGLEDWEFWLHCASLGFWGGNIPEYQDWYRRRPKHTNSWSNWDNGKKQREFRNMLRNRYYELWDGSFPQINPTSDMFEHDIPDALPCENLLKKEKTRVLMIIPQMTIGGADKFNLDFLRQMKKKACEITILTLFHDGNPWLHYFENETPDVFILHHFLRLADYPRFIRYLIHSRRIDVVFISHTELGYMLLQYLRSHFPDVTFVDFCHVVEKYWNNGGFPRISIHHQNLLDLQIVSSEHLKAWMISQGADPQNIEVCYTNIDTDEWRPNPMIRNSVRHELGITDDRPIILNVGRICDQKQPDVLAKTMFRLKQSNQNFKVIVAGEGPNSKTLLNYIRKLKLDRHFDILGPVSNERIKQLMTAADIFFLPSKWEGISLSVFESMACGLPVVTADVGGQSELIDSKNGFLISPGNIEDESSQYAKILTKLIMDKRLRLAIGKEGRIRVERDFKLDQMGDKMNSLIQKAMTYHKNSPRITLSVEQGHYSSVKAIEYYRNFRLPDEFKENPRKRDLRVKLVHFLKVVLEPLFQFGIKMGWTWLFSVEGKIKDLLIRTGKN